MVQAEKTGGLPMKVILPIEKTPLFLSRYESAICFSIIQAQAKKAGKDITPWLAGQMANVHHSTSFMWQFDTIKNMNWYADKKLFDKQSFLYDDRMPTWNRSEIIELLLQSLNRQKYIHTKINTFYVPDDVSYLSYSRNVECLIYGFDTEKETIYYARFFPDNPLTLCNISFETMLNAICEKEDHKIMLDILEFNPEFSFELNEKALSHDLYDFLNSTRQFVPMIPNREIRYGMDSLNQFRVYLTRIGVYQEFIDRKYVTFFYDFQTITGIRYQYLKESGYLSSGQDSLTAKRLQELSDCFLASCIEFNQTQNMELLKQIIKIFDEIIEIDTQLSKIMLEALKQAIKPKPI